MPIDIIQETLTQSFNGLQLGAVPISYNWRMLLPNMVFIGGMGGSACGWLLGELGHRVRGEYGGFIGATLGFIAASTFIGTYLVNSGEYDIADYTKYADRIDQMITAPILAANGINKPLASAFKIKNANYSFKTKDKHPMKGCTDAVGSVFNGTILTRQIYITSLDQEIKRIAAEFENLPEIERGSYLDFQKTHYTVCNVARNVLESPLVVEEFKNQKKLELNKEYGLP
jgi:hypothetical protein